MTIWIMPIEPLEERYSAQWMRWFPDTLARLGAEYVTVVGVHAEEKITQGEFLDVVDTNLWKSTQLSAFCHQLRGGSVRDGDWVLCLDAWSPAAVQLAYMRDLGGVSFKIAGLFHAGSYDPHDLLGRSDLVRRWAPSFERALFEIYDVVAVATELHCDMLVGAGCSRAKIHVTGFPLLDEEWSSYSRPWHDRPRRVVFPHRLAPEKAPWEFADVMSAYADAYPDDQVEWLRTKDCFQTKQEYYALLGDSRVAFSSARQETWGIAMLEAASLGCRPVVPARLSYLELYEREHQYSSIAGAAFLIRRALDASEPYHLDPAPGHYAIPRIARLLGVQ